MATKRDYYEVLGVDKNASAAEIKSAYRKKAKTCHPDLHPDDKDAENRFKELNEANEVLSDPDKRARYDQFGFDGPNMGGGNPFGGAGGFDFGGMGGFESIFDMFTGGMGGSARRNGPVQGNDLRYDLWITFEEAAFGCEKTFKIFRSENCDTCNGTGAKPGTSPVTCQACQGTGQIRTSSGWMSTVRTCSACGGTGKVIQDKCTSCGGSGRVRKERTVTIRVPAGIDDGQVLLKRGNGEAGLRGGPNGDLHIVVRVKAHKLFKRDGNTLHLDFPISFTTAALGGEVEIPTLTGNVKHYIPEGTQPETVIRLKGHGIQAVNSNAKGDMLVRLRVEIPRKMSEKQKDLLQQFEEASTGKEYESRKSFLERVKDLFNN